MHFKQVNDYLWVFAQIETKVFERYNLLYHMGPVENLSTLSQVDSLIYGFINKVKRKKQKNDWIKTVINDSYNTHIACQWIKTMSNRWDSQSTWQCCKRKKQWKIFYI